MARILLVEDDLDVRMLLEHVLLDAGYEVTTTETVTNAITVLSKSPFDLVISDGMLVDGTGIDIGKKAVERGVKVLLISGNALRLPREELAQFDYLLKPLRPSELIDAVRRSLSGRGGDAEIVPFRQSS